MGIVIKVEGLCKSYVLHHRPRESYQSLRDVVAKRAKDALSNKSENKFQSTEVFWALKDVSFEVNKGDRIGIIGRNGAGKSTLLKLLSRIAEPTKGKISIKGRVASLLEVGTGFHPELTGRENIFLNGSILGLSREEIKSKFDEIVDFAEVEKFLDTPVKRYSSGMYVRLAFAVAAHLEPEILIVDEVLAVGDAQFQKKCFGKMEDVSMNEGRTVLFVSHNMAAVQKLCDKGILLKNGLVNLSGNIDRVIDKYVASNEASQAVYEILTPHDVENLSGFAYRLQVEDINGNLLSEIPVGKPWQIRVYFKLNKKVNHLIIALGISNSLDVNIRTSWSKEMDLSEGNYEAVFKEKNLIFSTGKYYLALGLSSFERTLHYIENVAAITISDIAASVLDETIIRTSGTGLFLNPMEIDISIVK